MSNHWNGKLWYAYGTSMTSIKQGKYVPVVEKLSGLKVVNMGNFVWSKLKDIPLWEISI